MTSTNKPFELSAEGGAALLIRLSLGVLFFFAGLGKFLGEGGASAWSQGMSSGFSESYLPSFMVLPFAYVLPYVEVALGLVLVAGLFTQLTFLIAGLLLIALALGMVVQAQYGVAANNFNYVLMAAVGLWFSSNDNPYSADRIFRLDERSVNDDYHSAQR